MLPHDDELPQDDSPPQDDDELPQELPHDEAAAPQELPQELPQPEPQLELLAQLEPHPWWRRNRPEASAGVKLAKKPARTRDADRKRFMNKTP